MQQKNYVLNYVPQGLRQTWQSILVYNSSYAQSFTAATAHKTNVLTLAYKSYDKKNIFLSN